MTTESGMESKAIPFEHKKNSVSGKRSLEIPKSLASLVEFSDKDLKEQIKSFKSYELKKHADTKGKRETLNFSIKWNFAKFNAASGIPRNQNKNPVSKDNLPKPDKCSPDYHQPEKMNNSETHASLKPRANRLSLQEINFKENDKYKKECRNIPSIVIKTAEPQQERDCNVFLSVQHSPVGSILLSPSSCTDPKTDISMLLRLSLEKQLRESNLFVSNTSTIRDTEYFSSDLVSKLERKKRIIEKSEGLISKYTKGKKAENEKSYYTRGSGYPSIAPTPECSSLVNIEEPFKQDICPAAKVEGIALPEKIYNLNQKTSLDNSPQAAPLSSKGYTEEIIIMPHKVEEVDDDMANKCHEKDTVIRELAQIEVEADKVEKRAETQHGDDTSMGSTRLETNQVAQTRETNFDSLKTDFSTFASEILDREIDPYSLKSFEDLETFHEQEQNSFVQTHEQQAPKEDFVFEKAVRENCDKKRFSIQYQDLDEKLKLDQFKMDNGETINQSQEPSYFSEFTALANQPDNIIQSNKTLEKDSSEAKETIIQPSSLIPNVFSFLDPQVGLVQGSLDDHDGFNSLSNIYQQSLENTSILDIKEKRQEDLNSNIKEQLKEGQDEAEKIKGSEPPVLNQEDQQNEDKTSKSKKQKEIAASSQVFSFENALSSELDEADLIAGYRKRSASEHHFIGDNNLLFGRNSSFQSKESGATQAELESNPRKSSFKPSSLDIGTNHKHSEGNHTQEEIGCSLSSLNNESTKRSIHKQQTSKLTPLRIALDPLCTPGKSKDLSGKGTVIRTANSQDLSDRLSQLDSLCSECDSQAGPREEYYFLFDEHLDVEPQMSEPDSSAPIQEDFTKDLGDTLAEATSLILRPNDLARKDSHYDKFFAIFSENVSRVETFKKFGQHQAAIRLLEEILEEFEMEDTDEEDTSDKKDNAEVSENPKDLINLKYYKIQLYNMLSLELYESDRYEEALTYSKKVLKLDRYNMQALYKSYQANAKLKNDEEARSILKRVRKLTQLQSFSQSQQNLFKLDNISIPSQLSSLTNGSFCEGIQNMSFHSKLQGAVTKIWSKFKLNQLSNKIDESST